LQQQALTLARELERRKRRNRLATYQPYSKQREFHAAGIHRERLFMAGNQLGKT
jgi:phage terminase large subunit-like protein